MDHRREAKQKSTQFEPKVRFITSNHRIALTGQKSPVFYTATISKQGVLIHFRDFVGEFAAGCVGRDLETVVRHKTRLDRQLQ